MKKILLSAVLAGAFSAYANEIWVGIGKIGGDIESSTEYAIGFEKEFELENEWLLGIDISYKYSRITETEEEIGPEGEVEYKSKKVDENALDIEALYGMELAHHNKLFAVGGFRVGDSSGTTIYGLGVGVEFQHIFENEIVLSLDAIRHFMKTDNDYYYQTNTFMMKIGYEF